MSKLTNGNAGNVILNFSFDKVIYVKEFSHTY